MRGALGVLVVVAGALLVVFFRLADSPVLPLGLLLSVTVVTTLVGAVAGLVATGAGAAVLCAAFATRLASAPFPEAVVEVVLFVLTGLAIAALWGRLRAGWQDAEARLGALERDRLIATERAARVEAERANQGKEEFLSIISHELRAPLNAIVGWSYLLREHLDRPDEMAHAVEVIERNARLQARTVDDLLDMSRLLAGTLRFERAIVDLVAVVDAAVAAIWPSAARRRLTVEHSPAVTPVRVAGNAHRLQQVTEHLLSNAVKFTPEGGRITVTLRSEGGAAVLSVTDTGQGIDPEFLPHAFDRFRQADGSPTRQHGGLGIGLALVKGIVQQHGGTVAAHSEGLQHGSTFIMTLPLAPPATAGIAAAGDEASAAPRRLEHVRVLVVDDDAETCELLRRLLEEQGADVITSTSVQEALRGWHARPPDVLVSDINMPDRDGYALVREIRGLPPDEGGTVPAIALTALSRPEDQRAAIQAGFQVHLRKPVEPDELVTTVAAVRRPS